MTGRQGTNNTPPLHERVISWIAAVVMLLALRDDEAAA